MRTTAPIVNGPTRTSRGVSGERPAAATVEREGVNLRMSSHNGSYRTLQVVDNTGNTPVQTLDDTRCCVHVDGGGRGDPPYLQAKAEAFTRTNFFPRYEPSSHFSLGVFPCR